ncbi:MAG: DUF4065 domain-containing protein [Proteobacteria bacterium]|nr:DUF4065 domain-containing protein [Pseudomonadota bacterium]
MRIKQGISPVAVANYLLEKDLTAKVQNMDPLKLIYLVYQCHGRHLAEYGVPLVNELVEAWNYGTIFPSVFQQAIAQGDKPMTKLLDDPSGDQLTDSQKQLADEIYDDTRLFTGGELMKREIEGDTPWAEVYIEQKRKFFPISNKLIKTYYQEMLDAQYA